jgi:hypothetical protein
MSTDKDMERLRKLADEVLDPFLEAKGYGAVVLPDEPSRSPHVMKSVMERIDTADILVAELTGNNANVYYELAARHSLGLPYVLVSEQTPKFDLRNYFFTKYPKGRPQDKRAEIEGWLEKADEAAEASSFVDNPISDFYKRPLAEVSPAPGLALGYFRNFLFYAVADIQIEADAVEIERSASGDEWVQLTADERRETRLEVWIPSTLSEAFHNAIERRFVQPGRLHRARIVKHPRSFPLYALPRTNASGPAVLVDIPTALNALQVAVEGRMPLGLDADSAEWRRLERQEITRFRSAVRREMVKPENKVATEDIELEGWPGIEARPEVS